MAAYSVIEKSNISDYKWAAKIEDTSIPMEKYLTQLDGLSKDKRSPLTQEDKEYVLERMIEEELLIKRAIDLGMLNDNPMARGTIVQQMIKTILAIKKLRILIPLEGLIDADEEEQRLNKKISKLEQEKDMLGKKLNNKKFVDNAPKDLVLNQKDRFSILETELNNLKNQLIEIKKLI